jgi:hypothetical protein
MTICGRCNEVVSIEETILVDITLLPRPPPGNASKILSRKSQRCITITKKYEFSRQNDMVMENM